MQKRFNCHWSASAFYSAMEKKTVAILSDFPAWLINADIPSLPGHYPVWLLPLYYSFSSADSKFEIHWITLHKGVKHPVRFLKNNQFFHILPASRKMLGLCTAYGYDRYQAYKELQLIKPHLLHTWGTEYCYGMIGKDFHNGIWLHTVQGLLKTYMKFGPMARFQRIHSIYEPGVLRCAQYITTESPWASERVKEYSSAANPYIWDYAVEQRFFEMQRQPSETPTCLYCGSDSEIKNIATLIEAFTSPELSHVKLILAGPPKEKYSHIAPNIVALGRVTRDEVALQLSKTWALVHSSLADTGPTVVKEARVMGIPVILSNRCGSAQYVEQGKSGYIFEPYDVSALKSAVLALTESKEISQIMGEYNQKKCRASLSDEAMYNGLLKIYQEILGHDSGH